MTSFWAAHNAGFVSTESTMSDLQHAFSSLSPDTVIDAIEAQGFFADGRQLALNSYENRVYQVGLEDAQPIIAKFYRPGRWSDAQILEEHSFVAELLEQEMPVVGPMLIAGKTLFEYQGLRFSLFERKGGRAPELDNLDHLHTLGQRLGQMHRVGQAKAFVYRERLDIESFGVQSVATVSQGLLPDYLKESYNSLTRDLLAMVRQRFAEAGDIAWIRCHGDCHMGNILWRDEQVNFVDFDDARMAPAIQDLWMLLSGDREQQQQQISEVLEGYENFMAFNPRELMLIEPLRTLRMLHYCAWLARRWDDPAFVMHFPWFNTERYWGEHILELREQMSIMQEPALTLPSWR
jgi:Ser/Thr protein kinase RdoA (MazF antagonist)